MSRTDRRVRESLDYLQGHLSVLRRTGLDAAQRSALQAVEQSTGEVVLALEQLGDLVHGSAEEPAQSFRFDLKRSLDWVKRQFQSRARAHGISFAVEMDPDTPSLLLGDARRLRSVLVNLLDNALRYTSSGGVTLRVRPVHVPIDSQAVLSFEVSDSGRGLPEQLREDFLLHGFQPTGETAPSLAITERWLESMGAKLSYSPVFPDGSRFSFELTFTHQSGATPAAPRTSMAGKRVLIVDQSLANRRLLEKSLSHVGGYYQSSSSLAEALTFLNSGELPDAIILDSELPGGDQGEAAAVLLETTNSAIPLLLLVPVASRGDCARSRELGCRAYLVKPLQQEQILEALSAVLAEEASPSFITTHSLEEAVPPQANILLLTNEPMLSRQVEHHLISAGHRLHSEARVGSTLENLVKSPVELILIDEPGQTLELLPDLDRRYAGVPRIGLVSPSEVGVAKLTSQGIDELLFKPLRAWELSAVILRWAGREIQRAPLEAVTQLDPPIKIEVLNEATDGDRELQEEMITVFREDLVTSMAVIEQALASGQLTTVMNEAHSVKGSAPYFGADLLAELAQELENESGRGDATRSVALFADCRAELLRIGAFFDEYIHSEEP